jgi:hypothetical protein
MAITEAYTFSAVTVSNTELSIVSGTSSLQAITTAGVYQVVVDLANLAKADEFTLKVYETALAAGTKRALWTQTFLGAQPSLYTSPSLILMNGWDFTLIKNAGTDRAITASIRKVA